MSRNLTDAELDRAAKAYASENHVSYAEALQSVCTISSTKSGNFSESATPGAALSDEEKLHIEALLYATKHRVSYGEALQSVASVLKNQASSHSVLQASHSMEASDAQIDSAAKAYVQANGVSYSEALDCVRFDGAASFSEGATSGAALLARQPIEIFRAGTHTDSSGNKRTFTLGDVQAMAASYQPQHHEAPLVLGHPNDNKPAYGWVKNLQATPDGRLLMMADQIDAAFSDAVQAGRYKKRSASFYPPHSSGNPTPGNWYLKHVGWLGAQPPAIKGLADASFGMPARDGAISFEV